MMRILSTEDYLKEVDAFFKVYEEYYKQLCAINREENEIFDNGKSTPETEAEYEKKRDKLKEKYKGYTDIYGTDFACWLAKDNINKLITNESEIKFLQDKFKYIGKKVESEYDCQIYGKLIGIALTLDEACYVIDDVQTKEWKWVSDIAGIKMFNKKDHINDHKSYQMVYLPEKKYVKRWNDRD